MPLALICFQSHNSFLGLIHSEACGKKSVALFFLLKQYGIYQIRLHVGIDIHSDIRAIITATMVWSVWESIGNAIQEGWLCHFIY